MDIDNANCKLRVSECTDMESYSVERPLKIDKEITGLEKLLEELHMVFSNDHVNVQDVQKLMAGYKSDPKDWRKYAKYDRFRYTRNLVDAGNGAFNVMILCWGAGHASAIHDHADSHCFMKLLSGSLEEVRYDWPKSFEPEVSKIHKNNSKPVRRCCSESEDYDAACPNGNCQGSKRDNCENGNGANRNGVTENGANRNGVTENGANRNGVTENGVNRNGVTKNGAYRNGVTENGANENGEYDSNEMEEIGRTRLEINDVCYINDALGLHRMENPSHVDAAVSLHLYSPPFSSCRVFDARTGAPTSVSVTFTSMYGKKIKRVVAAVDIADSQ